MTLKRWSTLVIALLLSCSSILTGPDRTYAFSNHDLAAAAQWRAQFGFKTDSKTLSTILAAHRASKYGDLLTPSEELELDMRAQESRDLRKAMRFVEQNADVFGGQWYDQRGGHLLLKVALTSSVRNQHLNVMKALLPSGARVEFIRVDRSYLQLRNLRDKLANAAIQAGIPSFVVWPDPSTNQVVFTIPGWQNTGACEISGICERNQEAAGFTSPDWHDQFHRLIPGYMGIVASANTTHFTRSKTPRLLMLSQVRVAPSAKKPAMFRFWHLTPAMTVMD